MCRRVLHPHKSSWLRKMVAHRIADPVILGLIGKWLNAGAMQDGVVICRVSLMISW